MTSPTSAVRFTVGTYGILQIKLHGQDGTIALLGRELFSYPNGSKWFGYLGSEQTIPYLEIRWDGLKVFGLAKVSNKPDHLNERLLWDCNPTFSSPNSSTVVYVQNPPNYPESKVSCWRFVRYLPFHENDSILYGLTFFCSPSGGITGMIAHFKTGPYYGEKKSISKGLHHGCPIHFRLKDKETVTSLWTFEHELNCFEMIFLAIRTSNGRKCRFGPYIHSSAIEVTNLANEGHGSVLGIYYDAYQQMRLHISNIGVHCSQKHAETSPTDDTEVIIPEGTRPPFLKGSPIGIFMSQAPLSDITMIETCFVENRCTGMLINYIDGNQEVLGQWHETNHQATQKTIYERKNDRLFMKLYFKLSNKDGSTILRDVLSSPPSSAPNEWHSDDMVIKQVDHGSTVTWWFSTKSDVIHDA